MQRSDTYQEIRWAIDRMNDMISSLLECSKGRDTLRPAARNIVDTVERAIRMTGVRQEFPRITIKHHHEGLAVGWFDSNGLERVVANLVLNACEAVSPHSGQIVITTKGDRACLQIGVWDNGPGVPPTIQDSVFQPFVSYGKADGSGLGLAIAKKIVEDHGGEIYLDGTSETGTSFKITIPFAIPEGTDTTTTIPPRGMNPGARIDHVTRWKWSHRRHKPDCWKIVSRKAVSQIRGTRDGYTQWNPMGVYGE